MKKYTIILLSLSLLAPAARVPAQESTLLHFMRQSPQSLRSNPANLLDTTKFFVGVPLLSNLNFDLNLGFAYSDAIYRDHSDDSLRINRDIVSTLKKSSRLGMDVSYELLSFGIRFREDNMITFSVAAKAFGTLLFPKDIATLLVEGNTPGGVLSIDSDINASAYAEAALGYSRVINERWKMGVRVKYLAGAANVYSRNLKVGVATDTEAEGFAMRLTSDALVNMTTIKDDPFENSGLGFDAGVYYKSPVKGLEFSFSLIDWGYIRWNSEMTQYRSEVKGGSYEFKGITDIGNASDMNALLDTLKEVLKFNDTTLVSPYTSPLLGKIFLGAAYDFTANDKVGFLFSTRALQKFSRTTFGLMYNRRVSHWFNIALVNNDMLPTFFNPGLALYLQLGGFQFHLIGENLSSFSVKTFSTANIQFGMNIAMY
jgi:hypothetical protein